MAGFRVDELTDGYIRWLESENDRLQGELNDLTDGWNTQVDFIERQFQEEDFDFDSEYDDLLVDLEEINPEFVMTQTVSAPALPSNGRPVLHVVSDDDA